jgi:hypothetical protein
MAAAGYATARKLDRALKRMRQVKWWRASGFPASSATTDRSDSFQFRASKCTIESGRIRLP